MILRILKQENDTISDLITVSYRQEWDYDEGSGYFCWSDALTARENIGELLRAKGNLVKVEPYTHKVGIVLVEVAE